MPTVATELLRRLTGALGVRFTITDDVGAVVASTGDHPLGQIEPLAVELLRRGAELEESREEATARVDRAVTEPDIATVAFAGMFEDEPGAYHRVQVDGQVFGVLIAHGLPDEVRTAAHTAAISLGFVLEFGLGAARSARQGLGPDLAMHHLLRGSPKEARRTALVAKVLGWDLALPRVALVVIAPRGSPSALHADHYAMITEFADKVAPGTPIARMHPGEWVLLPELPSQPHTPTPRQLAQDILTGLIEAGAEAAVGVGERHAESSLPTLRRSYREARHAARWGERLRGPGRVYHLRDLGAMAFVTLDRATRYQLAEHILHPLRSQSEVLDSVRSFLECDNSIAAADSTGVHRHTIRHHLDRARELTGLDPRSPEEALQLRLALLVERHESR